MTAGRLWLELDGDSGPVELPQQGVLSIGSSPDAGLVLEARGVAAVHCAIGRIKGGGWAIKDLGTEAGTRINGRLRKTARLADGDELRLGDARLVVRAESRPSADAPRAKLPRIEGFTLERALGRGGMGAVYLAVQESLQRRVALKVMDPALARDADFVARFVAEARAAAALHHANVVTVFDVGEHAGLHYLAMEFMERGNLETRVARHGAFAQHEVLAILRDAAAGLVFAEQKGIVHRDIKPANLMQNAAGHTKIADLGLATQLEAERFETGERIFGTPHFIAPEQARGERVDPRSDLYALGATVYRLLSGRTPFSGETTREILRGHLLAEPPQLADLVPEVSPHLATLVHRMLAKDPAARPPSASVVAAEVEEMLRAAEPAGSSHDPTPASSPGRSRGARLALAGGVLVALGALALVGLQVLGSGPEAENPVLEPPQGSPAGALLATPDADGTADGAAVEEVAKGHEVAGDAVADPLDASDAQTAAGAGTDPGSQPSARIGTEDEALLAFERQADAAYEALEGLHDGPRVEALRALAERYAGTTRATQARGEADAVEAAVSASAGTERTAAERTAAALDAFVAAHEAEAGPLAEQPIGLQLDALASAPPDAEAAATPEFALGRRRLLEQAIERGHALVERARAATAELEQRGDFAASAERFESALAALALGDVARIGETFGELEGLEALARAERELRLRAEGLTQRRERHEWDAQRADALAVGDALRGAGIGAALDAFEFETARAALEALARELRTPAERARVDEFARDAERAARALRLLHSTHAEEAWRRRTILDPRGGGTAEVSDVTAEGLRLAGAPELLPWRAFSQAPYELGVLFHERLQRNWTPEERDDIATLLAVAAVSHAFGVASQMFDPGRGARFSESEAQSLAEGFDAAQPWTSSALRSRVAAERAAAESLAAALSFVEAGRLAAAVVAAERLFDEHADTLLVRRFADGSGLVGPPPPPE